MAHQVSKKRKIAKTTAKKPEENRNSPAATKDLISIIKTAISRRAQKFYSDATRFILRGLFFLRKVLRSLTYVTGAIVLSIFAWITIHYFAPVIVANYQSENSEKKLAVITTPDVGFRSNHPMMDAKFKVLPCRFVRLGPYFLERISPSRSIEMKFQFSGRRDSKTKKNDQLASKQRVENNSEKGEVRVANLNLDFCVNSEKIAKEEVQIELRAKISDLKNTFEQNIQQTSLNCPNGSQLVVLQGVKITENRDDKEKWSANVKLNAKAKQHCSHPVYYVHAAVDMTIEVNKKTGLFNHNNSVKVELEKVNLNLVESMFGKVLRLDLEGVLVDLTRGVTGTIVDVGFLLLNRKSLSDFLREFLIEGVLDPIKDQSSANFLTKYGLEINRVDFEIEGEALAARILVTSRAVTRGLHQFIETQLDTIENRPSR